MRARPGRSPASSAAAPDIWDSLVRSSLANLTALPSRVSPRRGVGVHLLRRSRDAATGHGLAFQSALNPPGPAHVSVPVCSGRRGRSFYCVDDAAALRRWPSDLTRWACGSRAWDRPAYPSCPARSVTPPG
jgi:hypothetical protein